VGIKHKEVMTTIKKQFNENQTYKIITGLMEENNLEMDKEINLSVLRDLCVVGVNKTMLNQKISYKVDYSTYENIMTFYNEKCDELFTINNNNIGITFFQLCDDDNVFDFTKQIIEMCVEDLSITSKKIKKTFINQLTIATLTTFLDSSIDEVEMIYQYGSEYFERYRKELPNQELKLVSG
jgi:hypothetical protein